MNRYRLVGLKPRKLSKKLILLFVLLLLIGFAEIGLIWQKLDEEESTNSAASSSGVEKSEEKPFNKTMYLTNKASSLWVVVNKGRILPAGYVPDLVTPDVTLRYNSGGSEMKLRTDAAKALELLFAAAAKDKIYLRLSSGYRSYSTQSAIYAREVRTYGQAQADRQSARPGHSEHQTGLAADLAPSDGRCEIADCFANTAEGKWLDANAYKYGFIISYPKGKEQTTGYKYEPWHFRYVDKDLAAEIHRAGQTLGQFFDLPSYASYPANIYELR